jgi:hypothetical protein
LAQPASAPEVVGSITYDSFETIPEFATLRDAVSARLWGSVESALAELAPEMSAYGLAMLADVDEAEEFLEASAADNPHSAAAVTALAMRRTAVAWQVRTEADAGEISTEQFTTFYDRLREAEQLLIAVSAEHPAFAPAWYARLVTARGLQLGTSEEWRRYRRLAALSPHDYLAQVQLLQHLLPKWMGTAEEAAAFAFDTAKAAPPGSNSGALVALYHVERWHEFGGGQRGLTYMAQPAVIKELREAAEMSVLHQNHTMDAGGVAAHNAFAMAFWLGKHETDMMKHLQLLDGRATSFPWLYSVRKPAELGVRVDSASRSDEAATP